VLSTFFGLGAASAETKNIKVEKPPPEIASSPPSASVRLQRLREGDYYLVMPRHHAWKPQDTDRVCAVDPGVRQFLTLYDPRGRTLIIDGTNVALRRRFDAIDGIKAQLQTLVDASKDFHRVKVHTRMKTAAATDNKRKKTAMARYRQRLRRQIWFTNRRVTRLVHDMHQKVTGWLASNYQCVLFPSFQTSEMVRLYEKEAAADGTPETSADERTLPGQAQPMDRCSTCRAKRVFQS
jgi:transposase